MCVYLAAVHEEIGQLAGLEGPAESQLHRLRFLMFKEVQLEECIAKYDGVGEG